MLRLNRCALAMAGMVMCLFSLAGAAHADSVTMNFTNADIRSVIKFVAEFSHKNFLVDNRVKGRVTIVSPTPIPAKDAYKVFLSILEVNGFTAIPSGDVVKIVPMAEGKQKAMPVSSRGRTGSSDALMTRLIALKHASAQQLVAVLRPLISPQSSLTAYIPANLLILTDTESNTAKILNIVHALDVNESVGVRLIPLKYASADKLAQTLQGLYQNKAVPGRAPAGPIKIIAYNPGNVLVIVAPAAVMQKIFSVVAKLDVSLKLKGGGLQVHYLKNADAEDMAKVVNSLVSGRGSAKSGARSSMFSGEVKVVADPATNALLITADPADHKTLNILIDKLDIRRLQVLIEALIIEISVSGAQQFGMEFRGIGNITSPGRRAIGGTSFSNQAGTNINTVAANPLNPGNGLAVGVVSGTVTFAGKEFLNLGALLRALETKTDANVLSTPNILTMDNEEAEIIVGQNVPFVTGSQQTTGGLANPFQTIQRQDVGLTLRVTPQISEGDTIRLKIFQEVSSVEPSKGQASDIVTNKRSIKTTVLANDGSIIVLGGLMRNDTSVSIQRVPCIGAIPIIGEPFKFTETSHKKTNMMVFLRPHIIRNRHDIDVITGEQYRGIEDVYKHQKYEGTVLFPQKKEPLPEDMNPLHPTPVKSSGEHRRTVPAKNPLPVKPKLRLLRRNG